MVVLHFPFSDLTQTKRRPALVLAALPGDDIILCQITSQASASRNSLPIGTADFASGGLNRPSFIRPDRLFTADSALVLYVAGRISKNKLETALTQVVNILTNTVP